MKKGEEDTEINVSIKNRQLNMTKALLTVSKPREKNSFLLLSKEFF